MASYGEAQLDTRAHELAETWINGNRSDAVAGVRGSAGLALRVREILAEIDPEAASEFTVRILHDWERPLTQPSSPR